MKNTLLLLMLVITMQSCKKDNTNAAVAPTDSTAAGGTATGEGSPMMVAMEKMMHRMQKLVKKGVMDYDLAVSMKEHHKSAVAMAEIQLKNGSDPQLKALATRIKEAQTVEIMQLDSIIDTVKEWPRDYDPAITDAGLGQAMKADMMGMNELPDDAAGTPDQSFAKVMLKHRQDGVEMAMTVVEYARNPRLKGLGQVIVDDQKKEIEELQKWLGDEK